MAVLTLAVRTLSDVRTALCVDIDLPVHGVARTRPAPGGTTRQSVRKKHVCRGSSVSRWGTDVTMAPCPCTETREAKSSPMRIIISILPHNQPGCHGPRQPAGQLDCVMCHPRHACRWRCRYTREAGVDPWFSIYIPALDTSVSHSTQSCDVREHVVARCDFKAAWATATIRAAHGGKSHGNQYSGTGTLRCPGSQGAALGELASARVAVRGLAPRAF